MRSDEDMGEMRALTFAIIAFIIVALLNGCVLFRPWAPSGHPPCPKGHAWNDSTLACKAVPRER